MMKRVTRSVVETSSSTTKCGPFSMAGVASSLPLSTGGVSNVDGTATAYAGTAITTTRIRTIDIGIVTLRRLVGALDVARLPRLVDGGFRGPAGQLARHHAGQDEGGVRHVLRFLRAEPDLDGAIGLLRDVVVPVRRRHELRGLRHAPWPARGAPAGRPRRSP